jgi:hypothetical protein
VQFSRPYYLCEQCHRGQFPADVELDVAHTDLSPAVRRMLALVGQQAPFDHGRQQMHLLAGLDLTTKSVERTAEDIGADIARKEQRQVDAALQLDLPIVVGEPIPVLYIEMDGAGVPVVKAETEGRPGKIAGQSAHTREAKLGCVFTQTTHDEEGYAIRGPDATTYTGAIETATEFGKRSYLEAWNSGWSRALIRVVLGDGAEWIWNLASQHFRARSKSSISIMPANTFGTLPGVSILWTKLLRADGSCVINPSWTAVASKRWSLISAPWRLLLLPLSNSSLSRPPTLRKTPLGCAMPSFANSICLSAQASSKLDVKPSSASASNSPACSGPSAEPTPSWLSAAAISMLALSPTGRPGSLDLHFYVAHSWALAAGPFLVA